MFRFVTERPHLPSSDLYCLDVLGGGGGAQNLDFGKYNFKYMVVECRDVKRLTNYLSNYGYGLEEKMTHHDYLFKYTGNG